MPQIPTESLVSEVVLSSDILVHRIDESRNRTIETMTCVDTLVMNMVFTLIRGHETDIKDRIVAIGRRDRLSLPSPKMSQ
jgi:hypothetical protein